MKFCWYVDFNTPSSWITHNSLLKNLGFIQYTSFRNDTSPYSQPVQTIYPGTNCSNHCNVVWATQRVVFTWLSAHLHAFEYENTSIAYITLLAILPVRLEAFGNCSLYLSIIIFDTFFSKMGNINYSSKCIFIAQQCTVGLCEIIHGVNLVRIVMVIVEF